MLIWENLVDEAVMYVDPSGVGPCQVTDKFLERRGMRERIVGEQVK